MNTSQGRYTQAKHLRELRARLGLSQQEMGALLGVTREWLGKLEREQEDFSEFVLLKMEQVAQDDARDAGSCVEEEGGSYFTGVLPGGTGPKPSTRADVEAYFEAYCAAAAQSGDPDVFPATMRLLKKHFPLDEFESIKPKTKK